MKRAGRRPCQDPIASTCGRVFDLSDGILHARLETTSVCGSVFRIAWMILAHDRWSIQGVTEGQMIFKTTGRRVEVEYERGMVLFVRLPMIGGISWTRCSRWERVTTARVERQGARLA